MPFAVKLATATLLMSVALTPLDGGAQTVPPSNADQNADTRRLGTDLPTSPARSDLARNGRTSSGSTTARSRLTSAGRSRGLTTARTRRVAVCWADGS